MVGLLDLLCAGFMLGMPMIEARILVSWTWVPRPGRWVDVLDRIWPGMQAVEAMVCDPPVRLPGKSWLWVASWTQRGWKSFLLSL